MTIWVEQAEQTTSWDRERDIFLSLPGTIGNFTSTLISPALDITGDIDIWVDLSMDDWTDATFPSVVTRYSGDGVGPAGDNTFLLDIQATGELRWVWSEDGTIPIAKPSTVPTGFIDGSRHWIRIAFDVDNGASGNDIKFYTSLDGITWVQLGATVTTAGIVTMFSGTHDVTVGSRDAESIRPVKGKIYSVQIYNGIDGTLVFDAQFENQTPGLLSFNESSSNGALVTVNQSGDPKAEIVFAGATIWAEQTEQTTTWS